MGCADAKRHQRKIVMRGTLLARAILRCLNVLQSPKLAIRRIVIDDALQHRVVLD